MSTKHTSFVVYGSHYEKTGWTDNTTELNGYLEEGWKVVSATPMGAAGFGDASQKNLFASLVILEYDDSKD